MNKLSIIIVFLINFTVLPGQELLIKEEIVTINNYLDGTLLSNGSIESQDLVIIIGDSGPTDRNGNQNFLKSNTLKKLATALTSDSIASFRYDKRIVKQIRRGNVDMKITFDDFVTDAKSVINYFKSQNIFSNIYVIGHGQGSLVGMLSLEDNVDGFISVAGSGKDIGDVIVDQVNNTARQYIEDTRRVIKSLKEGKTTRDYPQALAAMFNLETQPFMISWMAYNPSEVIKNIDIPILIINGTKDFQVPEEDAKLLANANTNSEFIVIENMNHVLFTIEGDNLENSKSYNESFREINSELTKTILSFIKSNR
jgi:pimeloyl-ACP methyl ester carboxylesterase